MSELCSYARIESQATFWKTSTSLQPLLGPCPSASAKCPTKYFPVAPRGLRSARCCCPVRDCRAIVFCFSNHAWASFAERREWHAAFSSLRFAGVELHWSPLFSLFLSSLRGLGVTQDPQALFSLSLSLSLLCFALLCSGLGVKADPSLSLSPHCLKAARVAQARPDGSAGRIRAVQCGDTVPLSRQHRCIRIGDGRKPPLLEPTEKQSSQAIRKHVDYFRSSRPNVG